MKHSDRIKHTFYVFLNRFSQHRYCKKMIKCVLVLIEKKTVEPNYYSSILMYIWSRPAIRCSRNIAAHKDLRATVAFYCKYNYPASTRHLPNVGLMLVCRLLPSCILFWHYLSEILLISMVDKIAAVHYIVSPAGPRLGGELSDAWKPVTLQRRHTGTAMMRCWPSVGDARPASPHSCARYFSVRRDMWEEDKGLRTQLADLVVNYEEISWHNGGYPQSMT